MPEDHKLSALTRSLILGVSLGTLGLTQVGCTTEGQQTAAVQGVQGQEAALLNRALQSRNARDVNAFLRSYPRSRSVVPLLTSLPASTVASLSPSAVSRIPSSTIAQLPARVRNQLPRSGSAAPRGGGTRTIIRGPSESDY